MEDVDFTLNEDIKTGLKLRRSLSVPAEIWFTESDEAGIKYFLQRSKKTNLMYLLFGTANS